MQRTRPGGDLTAAKLDAAGALGVPVVVIERPPPPPGVPMVATVAEALRVVRTSGGQSTASF